MRESRLLKKIRSGGVARVCNVGAFIPHFPHLAAHCGFDAVWVDAEHRAWDARQIETMLLQHRLADIDCVWRPGTGERTPLARLLEDGATALMIPMVNTVERARELVAAVKFPPLGDRGQDGAGLDADYLVKRPVDYTTLANRETALIAQIESPQAVENVDEIASVEGVDILFVGPGDLSLRLGCKPSPRDPALRAAVDKVIAAAKKHGKAWGIPVGNADDAKFVIGLGAQFVMHGSEFFALLTHLQQCAKDFDVILGESREAGSADSVGAP